jgi:hypothetical protein
MNEHPEPRIAVPLHAFRPLLYGLGRHWNVGLRRTIPCEQCQSEKQNPHQNQQSSIKKISELIQAHRKSMDTNFY